MNTEYIRDKLLSKTDVNVFDVFAVLYSYCEPVFNIINRELRDISTVHLMEANRLKLQNTVLPAKRHALAALEPREIDLLLSQLYTTTNQSQFDLRCFTLLRAIDTCLDYYSFIARGTNLANFPAVSQRLNLYDDFGHVYVKRSSPIYDLIKRLVGASKDMVKNYRMPRTGKEAGGDLRYYIHNFALLRIPAGYDVDFEGIDSTIRFSFPDTSECKIALVPLVDQTSQITREFSDVDYQDRRLFRFTGLSSEPDKIVEKAVTILRQLNIQRVTLVVFPELCMPQVVREAVAEGLKNKQFPNIKMVVAGSFHEYDPYRNDWYNITYVLGPDGEVLWQQRKLQPFTLMTYEAQRIPSLAKFCDKNVCEDIATEPRSLVVRDVPLGRMAVLICSDLLRNDPYRNILLDLGVNFIVVPSMTQNLDPSFTSEAKQFVTDLQATTLVSNCCAIAREKSTTEGNVTVQVAFASIPAYPSLWWCNCDNPAGPCSYRNCTEQFVLKLGNWPSGFK